MECFRLELIDTRGTSFQLVGTEEVMRAAYEDVMEAMESPDGVGKKVLKYTAWCDSADRAENTICVRVSELVCARLIKLYG